MLKFCWFALAAKIKLEQMKICTDTNFYKWKLSNPWYCRDRL